MIVNKNEYTSLDNIENHELSQESSESNKYCFRSSQTNRLCWKFAVASVISIGTIGFSMAMIATSPVTSPIFPFACSLLTGTVGYWMDSPKVEKT